MYGSSTPNGMSPPVKPVLPTSVAESGRRREWLPKVQTRDRTHSYFHTDVEPLALAESLGPRATVAAGFTAKRTDSSETPLVDAPLVLGVKPE